MVMINSNGYLCKRKPKTHRFKSLPGQNWFLVKHASIGAHGALNLGVVNFPKEYIGKRIRFKIEIIGDKK